MKYIILLIFVTLVKFVNGFLARNHNTFSTHLNKNHRINSLYSKKYEIYRLRRQKEISDAFEAIFTRQRGLRVGNNITPELIIGISIMEVKLNGDCTHADIYIVAAGDIFQQRQTFSWLNKNLKRLRYLMAKLLSYRKNVPTLQFLPYDLESATKNINEENKNVEIIEDGHVKKKKGWAGMKNQENKVNVDGKIMGYENQIRDNNTNNPSRKVPINKNKDRNYLLLLESV